MSPTVYRNFWWSWDDTHPKQRHVCTGLSYSFHGAGIREYMSFRLSGKV